MRAAAVALLALACGGDRAEAPPAAGPGVVVLDEPTRDDRGVLFQPAGSGASCALHGEPLSPDVVTMLLGLPYTESPEVRRAEQELFPNAATLYWACGFDGGDRVAVDFCAACREAELAFEREAAARGEPRAYDAETREAVARVNEELAGPR